MNRAFQCILVIGLVFMLGSFSWAHETNGKQIAQDSVNRADNSTLLINTSQVSTSQVNVLSDDSSLNNAELYVTELYNVIGELKDCCDSLSSDLSDLSGLTDPHQLSDLNACSLFFELLAQRTPEGNSQVQRGNARSNNGFTSREAAKAAQIKKKYAPELNRLRAQINEAKANVAKLLSEEKPNRQKIRIGVKRMAALRCQQQLLLTEQLFDTLDSLPPEKRGEYLQPIIDRFLR